MSQRTMAQGLTSPKGSESFGDLRKSGTQTPFRQTSTATDSIQEMTVVF